MYRADIVKQKQLALQPFPCNVEPEREGLRQAFGCEAGELIWAGIYSKAYEPLNADDIREGISEAESKAT